MTAGMDGCRPDKVPGKSPIGVHYKLKEVTPRSLAYTAVLVGFHRRILRRSLTLLHQAREVLTAHDWSLMDLDFNNCDFFNSLVALFALPLSPWAKETLDWWSMYVILHCMTDLLTVHLAGKSMGTCRQGPRRSSLGADGRPRRQSARPSRRWHRPRRRGRWSRGK